MPKKATGQVRETVTADGDITYAVRLRVNGKRPLVTLGTKSQGWSKGKAEEERDNLMADVRRGVFQIPEPTPIETFDDDPIYIDWANDWFDAERPNWKPRTIRDNRWALEKHLLPFFGQMRLSEITIEKVDGYRVWKQRQRDGIKERVAKERRELKRTDGALSNNSINKTISRLGSSLKKPVEYPRFKITSNPAIGKERRAKTNKPKRTWLDVEQIPTFVDVADGFMRPLVGVLVGCGLRIGEAVALDWRDVNLSTATIFVRESKTETGEEREVDIPLGALEELIAWKARSPRTRPGDPAFLSGRRRKASVNSRQTARNANARFAKVIADANAQLEEAGIHAIDHITPHGLRRTYASLRAAAGDDPVYIAEQGGWSDIRFVYSVYQKAAKRRSKLKGRYLVAFDAALVWAQMGTKGESVTDDPGTSIQPVSRETGVESRVG